MNLDWLRLSSIWREPYEQMGVPLAAINERLGVRLSSVCFGSTMLTSAPVSMRKTILDVASVIWSKGVVLSVPVPAERLFNSLAFGRVGSFPAVS